MNHSLDSNHIFFLDNDPVLAAQALFDDDLKKTILYLALVASAGLKELLPDVDWQKEGYTIYHTDMESPEAEDVRWIQSTPVIWNWARDYFKAMLAEHEYRFGFKHPSYILEPLFESEAELVEGLENTFSPPPISNIPEKYQVDSNFRSEKVFKEKKGKGTWTVHTLNSNRSLYKHMYDVEFGSSAYTARQVPEFLRPRQEEPTFSSGMTLGSSRVGRF